MPSFKKGPNYRTPFGKNEYLGSTEGMHFESYTYADGAHPTETIDDATDQKVLQPGTIVAKITSGADAGKVGVFQIGTGAATDGRQTKANIVGICNTFLPWQLMEHDEPVAVLTHGVVDPARVLARKNNAWVSLQDLIDAGDVVGTDFRTNFMDITLRKASTELE